MHLVPLLAPVERRDVVDLVDDWAVGRTTGGGVARPTAHFGRLADTDAVTLGTRRPGPSQRATELRQMSAILDRVLAVMTARRAHRRLRTRPLDGVRSSACRRRTT